MGSLLLLGLTLLSSVLAQGGPKAAPMGDEKRLISHLMDTYKEIGVVGRPVHNASETVDVTMGLKLVQIYSLDLESQVFDIAAWPVLSWTDPFLQWDPATFGNVDKIQIPAEAIWKPDIELFNSLAPPELFFKVNVLVRSSGQIHYVPAYRFRSSCRVKESEHSEPSCTLKFGSWTADVSQISLEAMENRIDAAYYTQSKEFELFSTSVEKHEKEYACCPGIKYGDLTYTIKLKRRRRKEEEKKEDPNSAYVTLPTSSLLVTLAMAVLLL